MTITAAAIVVLITCPADFQWTRRDTVQAVHVEDHEVVTVKGGVPRRWPNSQYVVEVLEVKNEE